MYLKQQRQGLANIFSFVALTAVLQFEIFIISAYLCNLSATVMHLDGVCVDGLHCAYVYVMLYHRR